MNKRDSNKELMDLRKALEPFARIWGINAALDPDLNRPVRDFIPGAWPTMDACKRAWDLTLGRGK